MIPVSSVSVPSAAEGYVLEVLRSGHLAQGEFTERLEAGFADLCDVKHAVAVSNGTVSLELAAVALGIGPGDEVITSPFTFVATVNAMLNAGATVRFVDIDPVTYCLDVSQVEAAITPATVTIAPVHLYGLAADMAPLMAIALRHSLAIIEDAAQAHGALYKGARVGSFGVGSFSFYATKNMTTGEGGMVTTNDDAVADRLRLLRNQGMRARYEYEMVGRNARMTDLQAAVGTAELEILPERIERRRANAAGLTEQLDDLETLVVPFIPADREHVFHQYTVRLQDGAPVDRDELSARLLAAGVGSGVYYPRTVHGYSCFSGHPRVGGGVFPEAERAARQVLSLPVHPQIASGDIDQIATAVREALGDAR